MWAVLKWFGRLAFQVFRWSYTLPGLVGAFIIVAARDVEAGLRRRREEGLARYPILNYLLSVALGVVRPVFEAGWLARASLEATGLIQDIVAGVEKRRVLKGLAPRVRAAQVTPWVAVIWRWMGDWLFSPAWLPG